MGRFLNAVFAGAMLIFVGSILASPKDAWVVHTAAIPHPLMLGLLAAYIAVVVFFRTTRLRGLRIAALSVVLFALYMSFEVITLGEPGAWKFLAATDHVNASEILGNLVLRQTAHGFGIGALSFVPPVFGLLAAIAWFITCDRLFAGDDGPGDAQQQALCALVYLGSGVQLVFFREFIENTQLSTPLLTVAVLVLSRYAQSSHIEVSQRRQRGGLVTASALLTGAAFAHGANVALLPAVPLAILIRRREAGARRLIAVDFALWMAASVLTAALVWVTLRALGVSLNPGNAFGGGDLNRFVPVVPTPGDPTERFALLSFEHLREIGNIALCVSPIAFVSPLLLGATFLRWRRGASATMRWSLSLLALGYLGFVSLWNFDLGFPGDYDLMISTGVPLGLTLLDALFHWIGVSKRRFTLACATVTVGCAMSWAMIGSFTNIAGTATLAVPVSLEVFAQGSIVHGETADMRVSRDTQTLSIVLRGPPRGRFIVLSGSRNPGNLTLIGIGTIDVGKRDLSDIVMVPGDLDENGRCLVPLAIGSMAPGTALNIQAVISQPLGARAPFVLTRAFYITVE